jgi:hemoglobin
MKTDITYRSDIEHLVNTFYDKVRKDELLGNIFDSIIKDRWPEHLEKMYRFWETVLLEVHSYHGSPFVPHAHLPVEKHHFERWIALFTETVDENFAGEKARKAIWQGDKMAEMFNSKIEYFRQNSSVPLL